MKITVAAVGRARSGPEKDLFEHYSGRIRPALALKEVEEKRPLPAGQMKKREGELLLAAIPKDAHVIALDSGGRELDSRDLAEKLRRLSDDGVRQAAFIIGGAEGLDKAVLARADLTISLGPMTWPHMLIRGMLAEQLYRAQCIQQGHPYHRE
ncbi:MAG: 23S rRNA (pseudouridine(1915)-N(3))-methyltransferase RlmH [Rhodospirillales bacterium]